MTTNRHMIAKLTKAFDQAALANGGHYKAQPCTHDHGERTTHLTYVMTAAQSLLWEGSAAERAQVEEGILDQLHEADVAECVVVLVDDGSVAYALEQGGAL